MFDEARLRDEGVEATQVTWWAVMGVVLVLGSKGCGGLGETTGVGARLPVVPWLVDAGVAISWFWRVVSTEQVIGRLAARGLMRVWQSADCGGWFRLSREAEIGRAHV